VGGGRVRRPGCGWAVARHVLEAGAGWWSGKSGESGVLMRWTQMDAIGLSSIVGSIDSIF